MTEHKKFQIITNLFKMLLVAGVIAALALGYFQITGLKSRMSTAENRLNEGTFYYDDSVKADQSTLPTYKIINSKDATVKVEEYSGMNAGYEARTTKSYTIEVVNTTQSAVDVDTFSIRARTDQGLLVSPSNIDPKDPTYIQQPISLAPGGKVTFTLYYLPVSNQGFTGLYDSMTQQEIK